jgi:hypothetical protein
MPNSGWKLSVARIFRFSVRFVQHYFHTGMFTAGPLGIAPGLAWQVGIWIFWNFPNFVRCEACVFLPEIDFGTLLANRQIAALGDSESPGPSTQTSDQP